MPFFLTDRGQPVPAVTTSEMRAVDRIAVEAVGPELLQMMENAGRTLAGLARERTDDTVVVLASDGGNGGGGLCAARHLSNHGWDVQVVLDRAGTELTGAAATQYRVLQGTDAALLGTDHERATLDEAGLVVDALVGYGLDGALRGRARDLVEAANAASTPVLSLDVPSGVDATTGETPGVAVDADVVLTLALPKTGLGAAAAERELWLADVGIPAEVYRRAGVEYDQPFSGDVRVRLRPDSPDAGGKPVYKRGESC
jgi:NAD(P)H-hydrate epimerase